MVAKSFAEEVAGELAVKTVMWGPAIAGGLVLGPFGAALGAIVSVVIVASGGNGNSSPRDGDDRSK
jgi:hypothetical protein